MEVGSELETDKSLATGVVSDRRISTILHVRASLGLRRLEIGQDYGPGLSQIRLDWARSDRNQV